MFRNGENSLLRKDSIIHIFFFGEEVCQCTKKMKNEEICPIKAFLSYAKPSIFPNAKNLCNFLAIPESCTRSIITEQCNLEISKSSLSCWWKLEISIKGFMRKSWVWAGHLKENFSTGPYRDIWIHHAWSYLDYLFLFYLDEERKRRWSNIDFSKKVLFFKDEKVF